MSLRHRQTNTGKMPHGADLKPSPLMGEGLGGGDVGKTEIVLRVTMNDGSIHHEDTKIRKRSYRLAGGETIHAAHQACVFVIFVVP